MNYENVKQWMLQHYFQINKHSIEKAAGIPTNSIYKIFHCPGWDLYPKYRERLVDFMVKNFFILTPTNDADSN